MQKPRGSGAFVQREKSALGGRANRAHTRASAAGQAGIGVDDVLAVALSDGIHGAVSLASAAADAFISDDVSHDCTSNKF
jgi:hypothetical protein